MKSGVCILSQRQGTIIAGVYSLIRASLFLGIGVWVAEKAVFCRGHPSCEGLPVNILRAAAVINTGLALFLLLAIFTLFIGVCELNGGMITPWLVAEAIFLALTIIETIIVIIYRESVTQYWWIIMVLVPILVPTQIYLYIVTLHYRKELNTPLIIRKVNKNAPDIKPYLISVVTSPDKNSRGCTNFAFDPNPKP